MKSGHHIHLAAHPLGLIGHRARQGRCKEHLAEAAYVNYQRIAAFDGHLTQADAKLPRDDFIKVFKDEGRFLTGNSRNIFSEAHKEKDCLW